MKIIETPLSGLLLIEPRCFADARGYFLEVFRENQYQELGLPAFVQDNISRSKRNTLRGLHYQLLPAQGKLVWVTRGTIWDVAVDIRRSSPTFGQWFGCILSDENHHQLYIPEGFAHGFCVLSDEADLSYKCTAFYAPQSEHGIAWNDATLNIDWPVQEPILSAKDAAHVAFNEINDEKLFA